MFKKSCLRGLFDNQYGKYTEAYLKSTPQHIYYIQWPLTSQLSLKKSFLLTRKILWLLVNTLAADEKYPVNNRDNLKIPIQMQLSLKEKKGFSIIWCIFEI